MTEKSGDRSPIPPVKKEDAEDVSWALQTAETMWGRGERGDAVKWIRRAAEAASEAEDDDRALELAKAAADLATQVGPIQSTPPAPPQRPQTSAPPAPVLQQPPTVPMVTPAPPGATMTPLAAPMTHAPAPTNTPLPTTVSAATLAARNATRPQGAPTNTPLPPAGRPAVPTARPPAPPPSPGPPGPIPKQPPAAGRPAIPLTNMKPGTFAPRPAATAATPARAPMAAARPVPQAALPKVTGSGPASRRGRRSSANLADEAKRAAQIVMRDAETTQQVEIVGPAAEVPKRRGRASRPAAEELHTPPAPIVAPVPPSGVALPTTTEDMDSWPTNSLTGDDLDTGVDEKTRIGAPAYPAETARLIAEYTARQQEGPELRMSQAIRVVVWRSADGVHVAPAGTTVNAISVEALLVALDPAADLASWLRQK